MAHIREHLGSNERLQLKFRPSRKAYLWEYVLFIFVMLVSFTALYPLIMAQFKAIAIIAIIAKVLFYILFTISIVLLIKVELKIWSILYAITDQRVIISKGIFTEKFISITYNKITDIGLEQSFWDKVFNIGKLKIDTPGSDEIEGILENVSKPLVIKKKISDLQTASKTITIVSNNAPIYRSSKK